MKSKLLLIILFLLGSLLVVTGFSSQAQNQTKSLTLLYSNNLNGEIDPCPT
jgi:hypothetical protein